MLPRASTRRPRMSSAPVEAPARLPPPSASRGTPLFTRSGFTDIEGSPGQFLPMQRRNGGLRHRIVRHLDKAKAAWAPRLPVSNQVDAIDHTVGREQFPDVLLCDGERE